jgi:TonB family protein
MLELPDRRAAAFSFIGLLAAMLLACVAKAEDEPVFDIGPGITPPRVSRQVNPEYKPDSEGFRITGTVIVGLVVGSKGEPKDVHVVRSLGKGVDESAVEAVRQWTFEPARKANQPVAVKITIEIRFHSM